MAGVLLRRGAGRGIPSARKEPLDLMNEHPSLSTWLHCGESLERP